MIEVMKIIEKIVDKFLNDGFYAMGLMIFSFFAMFIFTFMGSMTYKQKLEMEVKLAKIAAGQILEDNTK
jgi:hypothetical protein